MNGELWMRTHPQFFLWTLALATDKFSSVQLATKT